MPSDLPLDLSTESGAAQHIHDHLALHRAYNYELMGPYTINYANIEAGVELFTPEVNDWIVGLVAQYTSVWENDQQERIGIGLVDTVPEDLALKFPVLMTGSIPSYPTFPRIELDGIPAYQKIIKIQTADKLYAKCARGSNTAGSLLLWVVLKPAAQTG